MESKTSIKEIILMVMLLLTVGIVIDINNKRNETYKSLRKTNKELNNAILKNTELSKRYHALTILNLLPISFSNHMIDYCNECENCYCPFTNYDFQQINKIEKLFVKGNYDYIIKLAEKHNFTDNTTFSEFTKVLKHI